MNVTQEIENDIWAADRLGFADIGQSFTNIIQTIDDSKVISIEAPFGYGKTFFRKEWAKQLRTAGELVIEIDALQSDHSGDPLVTFVGALLSATPQSGKPIKETTKEQLRKWGGILGRATLKAVLREGAEEIISAGADWAKAEGEEVKCLEQAVDAIKDGLSSAAAQMIATHLAAEEARKIELPAQIDALRDALTDGSENKRIVIIVDELDRCHPEYAISLLEGMKLVFEKDRDELRRDGFVFVLMVNPNYLEDLAKHRFGFRADDELYLEKFIDLRLRLRPQDSSFPEFTKTTFLNLKLGRQYCSGKHFTVEAAADLASRIVMGARPSIRQMKRAYSQVELVTRVNRATPIDLPLLVALAFQGILQNTDFKAETYLARAAITGTWALNVADEYGNAFQHNGDILWLDEQFDDVTWAFFTEDNDGAWSRLPPNQDGSSHGSLKMIVDGLAPHYIPSHQAMLDGVMRLQAN